MTLTEVLLFFITDITLNLLVIALVIFSIIAIKSGIRSFQFQISTFIIIWIIGEVLHVFGESGFLPYENLAKFSPIIHVTSMILISIIFLVRYVYVKKDEKKFIANMDNHD